jgi:hypothetical protein
LMFGSPPPLRLPSSSLTLANAISAGEKDMQRRGELFLALAACSRKLAQQKEKHRITQAVFKEYEQMLVRPSRKSQRRRPAPCPCAFGRVSPARDSRCLPFSFPLCRVRRLCLCHRCSPPPACPLATVEGERIEEAEDGTPDEQARAGAYGSGPENASGS